MLFRFATRKLALQRPETSGLPVTRELIVRFPDADGERTVKVRVLGFGR